MNTQANGRLASSFKIFSQVAGITVILVGSLVLIGWVSDIPALKSVLPGLVTMKANTAFGFIVSGVSLLLLSAKWSSQRIRYIAQFCAFTTALVGLLTLNEYLIGWNIGIDQLLFKEPITAVGTSHPGRMAPTTAINFLILGFALLLLDVRGSFRVVQFFALMGMLIGLLNITGYAYGVKALYGIASYTQMAVHTAVAFIILSAGILLARPGRRVVAIVASNTFGGIIARRLLPVAIGVPLALGWLALWGTQAGLYSIEFAVSLMVLSSIIILTIIAWWNASSINRMDIARGQAEDALQKAYDELEIRVRERTAELAKVNEELRRANRALKTLSECNQSLVRIMDESDLLYEVCRILVEVGGYRLAWVGFAEQDEEKTVYPVAQAGYEKGYLQTLNITWSDSERGRGPTGTAIRTGKPSICRNILGDPKFAPWRDQAVKRGYASSIALPLVTNDWTLGALNIYAVEPDAFDAEELKLLAELKDNLTYGIIALLTRAEREQAEEELKRHSKDLMALNQALNSIIGITKAEDLYESICENALRLFDLKMVWLGLNEENCIKPVASAGFKEGYFSNIKVAWDDSPVSKGPVGMSIKTKVPYVLNADDPAFEPWREEANKKGYSSILGVPLVCGKDENSGTLLFYSDEVGYFADEKVELCEIFAKQASIAVENAKLIEGLEEKIKERTEELQLHQDEAQEARFHAEAANRAKSDFLANMSHELRTPLNSITGFSELLQDEMFGTLSEKQKEYVSFILTSARHLLSLINDVLDLSKVESGKMKLELSNFLLKDVLNVSMGMLREKAMKHGINLTLEVEPDADIEIEADEREFKQIIFNLLSNAVKFTPDGGSVWVRARRVQGLQSVVSEQNEISGELSLLSRKPMDYIEISVEDTGIGIKAEDMDKLFKTFTQLESTYTKTSEGTGLGLALTKKMVELHGGDIWAESEFGKGSRFIFALPIRQLASCRGR